MEGNGGIIGHVTVARALIYPSRSFMSMIPVLDTTTNGT